MQLKQDVEQTMGIFLSIWLHQLPCTLQWVQRCVLTLWAARAISSLSLSLLSVALPVLPGHPEAPPTPQPWLPAISHQTHEGSLGFRSHAFPLAHFLLITFNAATSPESSPRGPSKTKIRMFSIWPNGALGSLIPTVLLPNKEKLLSFPWSRHPH